MGRLVRLRTTLTEPRHAFCSPAPQYHHHPHGKQRLGRRSTILKMRREGLRDVVKLSASVGLVDEEGFPHDVVLDFVDPQVDPKTGTVRIRGVLANPKGLILPGMFVRVRLTMPTK